MMRRRRTPRQFPSGWWIAPAAALTVLLALATCALAHEGFPPEWCGGADCAPAAPGQVRAVCGGLAVTAPGIAQTVPMHDVSIWPGPVVAICGAAGRGLNRCNPANGDCTGKAGLGLLAPEDGIDAMIAAARAACARDAREAMRAGQSVPGLPSYASAAPPPVILTPRAAPPEDARRAPAPPVPLPTSAALIVAAIGALTIAARRR